MDTGVSADNTKRGPFEVGEVKSDGGFVANGGDTKMHCITQKYIYEDAILRKTGSRPSGHSTQ